MNKQNSDNSLLFAAAHSRLHEKSLSRPIP